MTVMELGIILKDMYENAQKGDQVVKIHLFGIKYADEIRINSYTPKEILTSAHMQESYQVEINNGIKLSKYVVSR
jgi:hypothetical protein